MTTLAHIAGVPVEETVAMALPALGAMGVAVMASLSNVRRRYSSRRDRRRRPGAGAPRSGR